MLSRITLARPTDEWTGILFRLVLVLFFGGAMRGFSAPYFNLYLDDQNFSETLIGTVLSVAALVELIMIPLFSTLADRSGTHRRLFRGLVAGYAAACMAMLVLPVPVVLIIGMFTVNVMLHGTFIFAMQLAFTRVEQYGKALFGRVRSMSSGGFMVASALAGPLIQWGQYAALFTATALSGLLVIICSGVLPASTSDKPTLPAAPTKRRRGFYITLASQFFIVMGMRNGFAFWLLHFRDHVGIPTADLATLVALSALFELPFYLTFDRFFGHRRAVNVYIIFAIGLSLNWVFTGMVTSMGWIIVLLIFRGMVFAIWNLSILVLINQISHPRNVATNQTLAQITVPSIAALVSGAPMGYLYEHFDPIVFFAACTIMGLIGVGVMLVGRRQVTVPAQSAPATAG